MGAGASSASKKREERNGRRSGRKEAWKDKNERVVNDHESLAAMGYRLTKTIGKGSYGKVKKAVSAKHGSNVAVKIIDCSKKNHKHHARFFRREKQVTCFANHPNIVKCYEVVDCKNKIYIMLEYVENGDLCRYIKKHKFVEESLAKKLFDGIALAISYLHSKNVAHRDLKLENILLSQDMTPKLSDFGFAKRVSDQDHKSVTFCGSRMYSCLEILVGIPYNIFKADIWSLGVILFSMLTGHFPFADVKELMKMEDGVSFIGSKQEVNLDAVQLIRKMLQANPLNRISIHEVCMHKWLKQKPVDLTSSE